ncbi:response regulator [Polluticaenibacter yanchengensis]|uniref:Response regulator transcription factor n=1 Tax=Polluticaenibacter yanchengensis TaxID=3014562 RepID=A0ABT4UHC4_9BACT|nr:response regulator transcription factor [Chitinophagaceae bacterium LY-5]
MGKRVAIAEDNILALRSIIDKLSVYDDIEVVYTANNGLEMMNHQQLESIDLAIMDIEMPVMDGIKATQQIHERYPEIKILMLTTYDDDDKVFNSLLAGATGYLLKSESSKYIYQSIISILDGGAVMSASIALKTINYIKREEEKNCVQFSLTERELEILTELKKGLAYKEIASKLFLSEGTVRKHIENIYRKLQVNNKVSAINIATENKIIK